MSMSLRTSPMNTVSPFQKKAFSLSKSSLGVQCKKSALNAFLPIYFSEHGKVSASASNAAAEMYGEENGRAIEKQLPADLREELLPKHVAVIIDGNRRWAVERDLPVQVGHSAGIKALRELCFLSSKWGIKVLTVFTFSTENWIRPKEEVDAIFGLLEEMLRSDLELMGNDIRVHVVGDRSMLPKSFQEVINKAEETTKNNSGTRLNLAINYSGRYDIIQASKGIAEKVKDGLIQPKDINEKLFEQELETKCSEFPHPDLLIRTSGELRVSNFLLWQLAYTEFFIEEKMFPDFGEEEFIKALSSFQKRKRRYGGYTY